MGFGVRRPQRSRGAEPVPGLACFSVQIPRRANPSGRHWISGLVLSCRIVDLTSMISGIESQQRPIPSVCLRKSRAAHGPAMMPSGIGTNPGVVVCAQARTVARFARRRPTARALLTVDRR